MSSSYDITILPVIYPGNLASSSWSYPFNFSEIDSFSHFPQVHFLVQPLHIFLLFAPLPAVPPPLSSSFTLYELPFLIKHSFNQISLLLFVSNLMLSPYLRQHCPIVLSVIRKYSVLVLSNMAAVSHMVVIEHLKCG